MGIENVKLVYACWTHLPDRAFRLLVFMAMVSMDNGKPPTFWGGREQLSFALGRMTPEEPAPTDRSVRAETYRKARAADFQAVKVALAALTKAGVAVLENRPQPGRNAIYTLHLGSLMGKAQPTEQGRTILRTGYDQPTEMGYDQPTPEEEPLRGSKVEDQVGLSRGAKSPLVTTSPADELDYAAAQSFFASWPDLGGEYMKRVDAVEGYQARVVAAANLARAERSAS
jgi:hypothetical protein